MPVSSPPEAIRILWPKLARPLRDKRRQRMRRGGGNLSAKLCRMLTLTEEAAQIALRSGV